MTLERPAVLWTPDQARAEIAARLIERRGERSVHSVSESGVGYQIVARLELGGNQNVQLEQLYQLCAYYGASLGGLLDPNRNLVGFWPDNAPSYRTVDDYVRSKLRRVRLDAGLGTKALAKAAQEFDRSVQQTWIVRVESGEIAGLDVIRLNAVCLALSCTLVDLLPAVLRGSRASSRETSEPEAPRA